MSSTDIIVGSITGMEDVRMLLAVRDKFKWLCLGTKRAQAASAPQL